METQTWRLRLMGVTIKSGTIQAALLSMKRQTLAILGICCAVASASCETTTRVTGPAPPVGTPVQLRWSAIPGALGSCQPTVAVSMSGHPGSRLTWTGMGLHVQEAAYSEDFDQAFAQRFWAGEGLAAGESASSNSAGFGSGMVHITYRFMYALNTDPPGASYIDSVSTVCQ